MWVVPIVALLIGGWLIYHNLIWRGPVARVRFETANGIVAGTTEVRCRSVRVGLVKEAQRVPKSDKLLQLQIDLGTEVRQIVAGIAEYYAPEQVIGRRIVVIANLAPRKLRGVESNGMVLAASPEGRAVLLSVDGDVPPGTKVK